MSFTTPDMDSFRILLLIIVGVRLRLCHVNCLNPETTPAATTEANFTTPAPITLAELLDEWQAAVNITLEDSKVLLGHVHTVLASDSQVTQASDLSTLVDIYSSIGTTDRLQNTTLNDTTDFIQASLLVADSLLDDRYTGFFQDDNCSCDAEKISPATKLVNTTEQLMRVLAKQILGEGAEQFNSSSDNIGTQIKTWDGSTNSMPISLPEDNRFDDSTATRAVIPAELLQQQDHTIVTILYRNLAKAIGNASQTNVKEIFASAKRGNTSAELGVLSKVLSVSIVPQPTDMNLFENYPVHLTFQIQDQQEDTGNPNLAVDTSTAACVYWDLTNSSGASWSSKGCSFINGTADYVICECRHLTSFAILMQIGDIEVSEHDKRSLGVISYVGCSLSIVGVILLVGTFALLNIHTERVLVHINLALAVGLARIMFLFSPELHSDACVAVALAIYYTNMASFFWMLVEGVHLYLQVVVVFNIEKSKLKLYMLLAWGIPIILSAVTVGIFSNSIRVSDKCWLQASDKSIWMFVAPMLVVIAANTYILIRVVHVIFKLSAVNATSGLSQSKQVAKATLVLQPVLGLTWIFGVLSVSSELIVFQYLFTVLNSVQGMLLFLLYCVFNSEVRETYKRRKESWKLFNRNVKISALSSLCSPSQGNPSRSVTGTSVQSTDLPLEDKPVVH